MHEAFYNKLVENIYKNDFDAQLQYLTVFAEKIRNMPVEVLLNYKTFFVPDDFYLYDMSEGLALSPKYSLYIGNNCVFSRRIVTPLPDFKGDISGFVGYDDGSDLSEEENDTLIKYVYLSKDVFNKGKHMFITPDEYRKAIEEQYIALVDGIYDKEMLSSNDVNATSLLGSAFTSDHRYYLKEIKHWLVPYDADNAGVDLYNYCKMLNPNTVALKFLGTKDIDAKLKQPGAIFKLKQAINQLKSEGFLLNAYLDFDELGNIRKVPMKRESIIVGSV